MERAIIKVCDDGILIFYDRSSIYLVSPDHPCAFVFHKWFAPLGTYDDSWRPFRQSLLNHKHLTASMVFQIAYQYGVLYRSTVGQIDLKNKPVMVKYDRWAVKGVLNEL